ncbi:helix-turn-helix domain-containing protein [Verrucomicrobiota bacterium]
MSLGRKLHDARLKKKMSASEVAASTRMMVQIVEDLEREDFRRVAAPIYGKGFIRMYAEAVGLDPKPLINEYMLRFANPKPAFIMDENESNSVSLPEPVIESPKTLSTTEEDSEDSDTAETEQISLFSKITDFAESSLSKLSKRRSKAHEEPAKTEPLPEPVSADNEEPDLFEHVERGNIQLDAAQEASTFTQAISDGKSLITKVTQQTIQLTKKGFRIINEKLRLLINALRNIGPDQRWNSFSKAPLKYSFIILGILIVIVFTVSSLYSCMKQESDIASPGPETGKDLQVAVEPPAPYFD